MYADVQAKDLDQSEYCQQLKSDIHRGHLHMVCLQICVKRFPISLSHSYTSFCRNPTVHSGTRAECTHVLLTKHPANTVKYQMYWVRYFPCVRSITHYTHGLTSNIFFLLFFVVFGVKVQSIFCDIGPFERSVSRNMDRCRMSGMSGVGKLHGDGHVLCKNSN